MGRIRALGGILIGESGFRGRLAPGTWKPHLMRTNGPGSRLSLSRGVARCGPSSAGGAGGAEEIHGSPFWRAGSAATHIRGALTLAGSGGEGPHPCHLATPPARAAGGADADQVGLCPPPGPPSGRPAPWTGQARPRWETPPTYNSPDLWAVSRPELWCVLCLDFYSSGWPRPFLSVKR